MGLVYGAESTRHKPTWHIRAIPRWLAGRLLPRIAYPVLTGPLRGAWFVLGSMSGEGGGASVYVGQMETAQTATMMAHLGPGKVVFDIGANIGYYSLLAARYVGDRGFVLAVEPAIRNIHFLYEHIQRNSVRNVAVLGAACADKEGLAAFDVQDNYAMGRIVETDHKPQGGTDTVLAQRLQLVPVVTVDAICAASGLIPDVIKIYVEGAELRVLQGAAITLERFGPTLLLSVHSDELRGACLEYVAALGYAWQPLGDSGATAAEFIVWRR